MLPVDEFPVCTSTYSMLETTNVDAFGTYLFASRGTANQAVNYVCEGRQTCLSLHFGLDEQLLAADSSSLCNCHAAQSCRFT